MRPIHGPRVRGWLGASAFATLVVAHAVTYSVAAPDRHDRMELLQETGHGNWTSMFVLAGAALVAGVVAFASRWAAPEDRSAPPRVLFTYAWKRLVPLQVVGFLALECAERAFEHASALAVLSEPVVLLGLLLQVLAAVGCALLLVAFTHLVRRLRSSRAPTSARARITLSALRSPHIPRSMARLAWNLRGPPALLRSS